MSDDIKIKSWKPETRYLVVLYQKTVIGCIDARYEGNQAYFHTYAVFDYLSKDAQYAIRCAADEFITAHKVFMRLTT